MAGGGVPQMLQSLLLGPLVSKIGKKKLRSIMARVTRTDLDYLASLLAAGTIVSVIDRRYPLRDTADAIRYIEQGHARGKIVITMD